MPREAVRLVIEGRVQGVGYRWWAVRTAQRLGLAGWVRNRADGTVEALAIGEGAALARFIAACRQGPPHASVTALSEGPGDDDGAMTFEQRPTA